MGLPGPLLRAVVALLLLGALAGCGASAVEERPVRAPSAAVSALGVLRSWDRARAEAWAAGDRGRLARLYAAGSAAGRTDLAHLDRWSSRGWRVEGMTMQVLGVRLEARSADRLVLVVTDRLTGAVAVGHGRRGVLPSGDASTRRIEIRRVEGRWVLWSVRPRTDRPRGAS
jgi:hypothetical protein